MNQTASKPWEAIASHSADGTVEKSTSVPYFRLSSESHSQVLISYKNGYCATWTQKSYRLMLVIVFPISFQ